MIDHILVFPDEATAFKVLIPLGMGNNDNKGKNFWNQSFVIPNIQIITSEAVWDMSNPQKPVLKSPQVTLPGFWIAIALPKYSKDLVTLPGDVCRLVVDRDLAALNNPNFIRYVSPTVDTALLSTARVAPVFAGSAYTFRNAK